MRVVIGAHALVHAAGTETYVALVARELQRLGHDVVVTAEETGAMARHIEGKGVVVARDEAELPSTCDAILANDVMSAAALAARFPRSRLVHVAHSGLFDHQLPVLLPGVVDAVVVCSDRVASRIRALDLDVPIVRLRLPVDTDRFAGGGPLPARPRRALIVSNYLTGERRRALTDAWAAGGVACEQIGGPTRTELDPAPAMRMADIVVAKGGAALEAMACGRAVYVYDQFGGDGWITADNYTVVEADNLAGQSDPAPRDPAQLAADLAGYTPDMGWINEELARTHHGARRHAQELVGVLRGGRAGPPHAPTVLREVRRLTREAWAAQRRALSAEREMALLQARVVAAEALAETHEQTARDAHRHRVHAGNAERELAAWTARAERAETGFASSSQRAEELERRLRDAERELGAWVARAERAETGFATCSERALELERRLSDAEQVLATARAQAALAAGRVADGLPRRG